jgi:ATP-dependent helicase/nuclease subunit B
MTAGRLRHVFSLPAGTPFLPSLVDTLVEGRLVQGFCVDGDPLSLADVTIYVPTRRAARELRGIFMGRLASPVAILPTIRPLGEVDDDAAAFTDGAPVPEVAPPVGALDRVLMLAPLVRRWKRLMPAHVAQRFAEEVVVPASTADAIWLARDLAALIDEFETEGADWRLLEKLVEDDLAGWWQVTLEFLRIVTDAWPAMLAERGLSDPAVHRAAAIRADARRLSARPPAGPVIAAGSTGSIPATADLLATIATLDRGAVVLPGLDRDMDEVSWSALRAAQPPPAVLGHPQYGLAKLLGRLGLDRDDVRDLAMPTSDLRLRARLISESFRPTATVDAWVERRRGIGDDAAGRALDGVTLVEAVDEREEAVAVAIALRRAVETPGKTAALVTADRDLARRVCAELLRYGVRADDSGGRPLSATLPAEFMRLLVRCVFEPGDPVPIVALLKHPLLRMGWPREVTRRASQVFELVALRGGFGRPDLAQAGDLFEARLQALEARPRKPYWWRRLDEHAIAEGRTLAAAVSGAVAPLRDMVAGREAALTELCRATVAVAEALVRDQHGSVADFYAGDAGEGLSGLLRRVVASEAGFDLDAREWPDVFDALLAVETVKPAQGSDPRIFIWGAMEARLLSPDTIVVGGLNEGVWPRGAESDRFLSRMMKTGLSLEPPERRIGQAAHDFQMALGNATVVLTRSARTGGAPAVASRWLQRLLAFTGVDAAAGMRARGAEILAWTRALDRVEKVASAERPAPAPPLDLRPKRLSITEVETLRRDPYAVYARRVLELEPLDPLTGDPGKADLGTLFHLVLQRFTQAAIEPVSPQALDALIGIGRAAFAELALPTDVLATWWPRFERLAPAVLAWEADRHERLLVRVSEARAVPLQVGDTGVELSGYADRIDILPGGMADILDFKTGLSPSKRQAHTLVAPQLPLEAAMLRRGAFAGVDVREVADLAYVRLKTDGSVAHESILSIKGSSRSADDLAEEGWARLERLLDHYRVPTHGYRSRTLPYREDLEGPYDHLARVLEWSAGGDDETGGGE